MSQYLDKDGASRIAENFLLKQAEQDAILQNLQFDLKEAEHALVKTIQGPAPLNIRALTRPFDDYLISGNTVQDGVPSPDMPVDVVGCGVRTENLFDNTLSARVRWVVNDRHLFEDTKTRSLIIPCDPNTEYTISKILTNRFFVWGLQSYPVKNGTNYTELARGNTQTSLTFTTGSNDIYLLVMVSYDSSTPSISDIANSVMLNTGSTALPYEPYGYKLPPTVNGTEHPIYLGQVPTTRRIRKLVLTGGEAWTTVSDIYYGLSITPYVLDRNYLLSTHFFVGNYSGALAIGQLRGGGTPSSTILFNYDNGVIGAESFKSYLAAQYVNGTPVTVWYVLATPETGIVNEPLHKIGDYADTISYAQSGVEISTTKGFNTITTDTAVLPSNIEVKGVINNA